jgi:hypothetical protein
LERGVGAHTSAWLIEVDSDDKFEYRHVILPKQMLKLLPKQ